jgi:uncharacterized metal-binding protein
MSECECGGGQSARTVYVYACSGGANVAEIADRAARGLMNDGCGAMFCLAGLGADIQGMVQTARDADLNMLIDGCAMDCAKKVFDRHGLTNYKQIKVTDLGIEKAKGAQCTDQQIALVIAEAGKVIAESR